MAEIGIAFQTEKPHGQYSKLAAAEAYGLDVVSVFADLLYLRVKELGHQT